MGTSLLLAATALLVFAVAISLQSRRRERHAERHFPPTGQLVPVTGGIIHAHVEGTGPDLILIHGASGSTRDFTFSLVKRLAKDWRVIALDRPGLGWSSGMGALDRDPSEQVHLLQQAAGTLGVRRPVVLGHSYGASLAMAWPFAVPPSSELSPSALVILSGATMPWPGGIGPWYRITGSLLGRAFIAPMITALAPRRKVDDTIREIFEPDPVPDGYSHYIGTGLTLRRATQRANARQVSGLKPHLQKMAQQYHRLNLTIEILHGTEDTIVPAHVHAIPLSSIAPNARLTLIESVGHMPHHSASEPLFDALNRCRPIAESDTDAILAKTSGGT